MRHESCADGTNAFPIILGNDGAGTLDDGAPVVIYPVMGSDEWRGDETLDPHWHIFSEFAQGTFADYVALPKRNAIPLPEGIAISLGGSAKSGGGNGRVCAPDRSA
jgi:NADPH:quinone reductase-like Zn-dependent oxidoreductase